MSKIGKQPISVPNGVTINYNDGVIEVKGKEGVLSRKVPPNVSIKIDNNEIIVGSVDQPTKQDRAMWGTWRALINNMVIGVSEGFKKVLEYKGVGYKAVVQGKNLELSLGFSHDITFPAPDGIEFATEKNSITISGIDKELIGQVAAKIRRLRPPEPYKGAGIKYENEVIRRKEGKKVVGSGF
jgi:large subunit ribosomal protein L6